MKIRLVMKALDRTKLHPEKVQVKGKAKTSQGIRWKKQGEAPKQEKPPGAPTQDSKGNAIVGPGAPKAGGGDMGAMSPKSGPRPMNNYPQGKGPKGGGPIPRDSKMFGNKPAPKLGSHGKNLKPTGSFHEKTKLPEYQLPEEAKTWKMQSIHTLEEITSVFKKREKGQGKQMTIPSIEDLDLIIKNTTFACVSAGRNPDVEEDKNLTDQQISERFRKLKDAAKDYGYVFTDAIGKYGQPEETIMLMIHDADEKEIVDIGNQFNQQSVFISDKGAGRVIQSTPDATHEKGSVRMKGDTFDYVPDADDFYTEVQCGGQWVKFRHDVQDVVENVQKALRSILRWVRRK